MKATDLPISQGFPEGNDAIQRGINAVGPNNDACYLWTENQTVNAPTPPFFDPSKYYPFMQENKIMLGNNEFIIVYGVNHVATEKATYSSFDVYGEKGWNGLKAITDKDFSGSAEEYLPDHPKCEIPICL